MINMNRQAIYIALGLGRSKHGTQIMQAIDSERAYQDEKWGDTASSDLPGDGSRAVEEFALYIMGYAADLLHTASHFGDPQKELRIVRKIAGLCVACLEQHGDRKWGGRPLFDIRCDDMPTDIPLDAHCCEIVMTSHRMTESRIEPGHNPDTSDIAPWIVYMLSACILCMEEHGAPARPIGSHGNYLSGEEE
jgi:hypothetical protein